MPCQAWRFDGYLSYNLSSEKYGVNELQMHLHRFYGFYDKRFPKKNSF